MASEPLTLFDQADEWSVPNTPEAVAEAVARVPRALILLALVRALDHLGERGAILGSLIVPAREVRTYFDRVWHRDPPLWREWLTDEFMRLIRSGWDVKKYLEGQ